MGFATYFESSHNSKVEKGKNERNRRQKRHWKKLPDMYHGQQKEKTEMHWEQKFCLINGVRWKKLLETKKCLHLYSDITGWDDSIGKEAFDNAKARYWAQINGLQRPEIPLPDPDMVIDIVDHETPLSNLKLYENLHGSLSEDEADVSVDDWSVDGWGDGGVILWDLHYAKKEEEVVFVDISTWWGDSGAIKPTGWGDDEPINRTTYDGIIPTGWGEAEEGLREPWNGGVYDLIF